MPTAMIALLVFLALGALVGSAIGQHQDAGKGFVVGGIVAGSGVIFIVLWYVLGDLWLLHQFLRGALENGLIKWW